MRKISSSHPQPMLARRILFVRSCDRRRSLVRSMMSAKWTWRKKNYSYTEKRSLFALFLFLLDFRFFCGALSVYYFISDYSKRINKLTIENWMYDDLNQIPITFPSRNLWMKPFVNEMNLLSLIIWKFSDSRHFFRLIHWKISTCITENEENSFVEQFSVHWKKSSLFHWRVFLRDKKERSWLSTKERNFPFFVLRRIFPRKKLQ